MFRLRIILMQDVRFHIREKIFLLFIISVSIDYIHICGKDSFFQLPYFSI